jgi:hypothetical protein
MQKLHKTSIVRQRMLRMKKRKRILRRQQSLREMVLLAKQETDAWDRLQDTKEPSAETE